MPSTGSGIVQSSQQKNKTMKKLLLTITLILCGMTLFAQKNESLVNIEVIVSDNQGNVLKDVAIYNSKNKLIGITNHEGITWITSLFGDAIIFSHLSFEHKIIKISEYEDMYEEEFNNFKMIVKMEAKSHVLPEVTIVENAPQLAYKNKEVWVLDYSVDEKGIMAVTTDGKESQLLHLGFEQDTISIKKIDKKLDNLFREILYQDLFGNTHLYSLDSAFQIYSEKDKLELLYGVTLEKHKSTFGNLYALTDSIVVTRNEFYSGQEIVYFMTNRNNGKTEVLCDVYGSSLKMAKNWHIDNVRLRRALNPGSSDFVNPYERPEEWNNFEEDMIKRLMLQEIYVPLLNVDNKIYIFDFQKDYVYKYNDKGRYLGKKEISFHLKSKYARRDAPGNPWDKKLIYDKARKECYAQFTSDGTVTLKKIDLESGNVIATYVLDDHYFPENIQVYDGTVYYQFIDNRMTFGKDCRSLYKMELY